MKKLRLFQPLFLGTLLIFFILSLTLGFLFEFYKSRLKTHLISKISNWSETHFSAPFCMEEINVSFFPLGLSFHHLVISPGDPKNEEKGEDNKDWKLTSLFIPQLRVTFNLWGVFRGWKHIFRLEILDLKMNLMSKNQDQKKKNRIVSSLFPLIRLIPFPDISLKRSQLNIDFKSYLLKVKDLDVWFRYFPHSSMRSRLILKSSSVKIAKVKDKHNSFDVVRKESHTQEEKTLHPDSFFDGFKENAPPKTAWKHRTGRHILFQLMGDLTITEKGFQLNKIEFTQGGSYIRGHGFLKSPLDFFSWKRKIFTLSIESHWKAQDLYSNLTFFFDPSQIPSLKGEMNLKANLQKTSSTSNSQFKFKMKFKDVFLSHRKIGSGSGVFVWREEKNVLDFSSLKLRQESGFLEVKQARLFLSAPFQFDSLISVKSLKLNPLLINLGFLKVPFKNLPLSLEVTGLTPCHGRLYPSPLFLCQGHAHIENFSTQRMGNRTRILKLKNVKVSGEMQINKENVFYKADLKHLQSSARSVGQISYKKGFRIFYQSFLNDLSNLDLLNLKMKGKGHSSGIVYGNRKHAIVESDISLKSFWINNFKINRAKFSLNYKKKKISFNRLRIWNGFSFYKGSFAIHTLKKHLSLAIKAPRWEAKEFFHSIKENFYLPFPFQGRGKAEVQLWGPLDYKNLNYNLKAFIEKGQINEENFLNFKLKMKASKGWIQVSSFYLEKELGSFHLNGDISPEMKIKAKFSGNHLLLEEFKAFRNIPLSAKMNFKGSLRGSFLSPEIEAECYFTRTSIHQREVKNSYFKFLISKKIFQGQGHFMGNKIKTNFQIPFNPSHPFRFFLKTSNFDIAQILELLPYFNHHSDLKTNISSVLNLKSEKGGFWNSSGNLKFSKLKISESSFDLSHSSSHPIYIKVKNGSISTDFKLNGKGGFFHLISRNSKEKKLNLFLQTKVKMKLLSAFLNPLKNVDGDLSASLKILEDYRKPHMFGSAFLEEGQAEIKGTSLFLKEVKSDILFDHKNIVINFLSGSMGKGFFSIFGKMKLPDKGKPIRMNLSGDFKNLTLASKDFKVNGLGTFTISGQKSPYKIKGVYEIQDGFLRTDFSDYLESKKKKSMTHDFFNRKSRESYFHLDFNLHLKKALPVSITLGVLDVQALISGSLNLKGSPYDPFITGVLSSKHGGNLIFNATHSFDIKSGKVIYSHEKFKNPELNILAESRLKSSRDGEYEVQILTHGPLKDLNINLTSHPYLQEEDIFSLLVMGTLPVKRGSSFQNEESSYILDTTFLSRKTKLAKILRKRVGVDFNVPVKISNTENTLSFNFRYQYSPNFMAELRQTLEETPKTNVRFEYKFNKSFSLLGQLEQREQNSLQDGENVDDSILGLDLEYKVEF